jgi:hypothetical protein
MFYLEPSGFESGRLGVCTKRKFADGTPRFSEGLDALHFFAQRTSIPFFLTPYLLNPGKTDLYLDQGLLQEILDTLSEKGHILLDIRSMIDQESVIGRITPNE